MEYNEHSTDILYILIAHIDAIIQGEDEVKRIKDTCKRLKKTTKGKSIKALCKAILKQADPTVIYHRVNNAEIKLRSELMR